MQHIQEDQIWWTFARWWHFSTCWFQMFHIISSLYNIFHFTIQAIFSLVMVNLISLPSLYSSDLTCTSHMDVDYDKWQMMLKKKDEVDLAICLDQLSCTMAVASHIWTLSGKVEIVFHLCSCYLGIVQVNYHRPDSRWRRLHCGRWTSPDPASPHPPNHRNT